MTRLGRAVGPGRLFKVGPMWTLDYRASDGRRVREALSRDRKVAERIRSKRIAQRDLEQAGLGAVEGQSRPIEEILNAFTADLETRTSPRYRAYARQRIEDLLKELRVQRVCDLRTYEVLRARARMLAAGRSPVTCNHKVSTLQGMLNWALRVGLIAENPIKNLPKLPQPESERVHRRRAMTEVEIGRFLAAAREDDRMCLEQLAANSVRPGEPKTFQGDVRRRGLRVPQAPLWRAFLECGCRFGELTRARWADIDLDRRVIYLRAETTKTKRSRQVPLLDGLVAELRTVRETQALVLRRPLRPDDRIFLTPAGCAFTVASSGAMKVFDRLLVAAEIERVDAQGLKLDIHALRHTAASRLLRVGVPLQKVQHVLGHADSRMTSRIYAHLAVEDLRDAVEAIPQIQAPVARRDAS